MAGKKILDQIELPDLMTPEQIQGSYAELKKSVASRIVEDDEFLPETSSPLSFERIVPTEMNEHGEEVPKSTWHFSYSQYLENLAKGIYPISRHRGNTQYHDALHAAELSILQKYCPEISQLIIDVAEASLDESTERQEYITLIIDYFTDTFSLDDMLATLFEWRASELYRLASPELPSEETVKKAKALMLKAVSGMTRHMTEHATATTSS